ncbi:RimK family protein [Kiritimatiellaeota bacterium B1221]|nr:RimK family protein [Kiritimatiellaeota bacterium B1221]
MHKTLVVTDQVQTPELDLNVISFDQYLSEYPKLNEPKIRIINLCDTTQYLSRGYYCSLLAESRQHKVLPSVSTINDLRNPQDDLSMGLHFPANLLPKEMEAQVNPVELDIFFGWTSEELWRKSARILFDRYSAPYLHARIQPKDDGCHIQVERGSLADLSPQQLSQFYDRLKDFTERVWRRPVRRMSRWDLAILHNPDEANSPSDPEAIKRFVKAASKLGVEATVMRSRELKQLSQYDALFIRETTHINHPTYRLARRGEMEGLVVIDDATSILRCCNKIYLHDAFSYKGVQSPLTMVLSGYSSTDIEKVESQFSYPLVLKMPESSFSLGIYKVATPDELRMKLQQMFKESALVLVQEYLFTEFDWRIGVLNGRAIYACKYFMARDHWQIYNHDSTRKGNKEGAFETIPTFEAPRKVLDAALKACSIIGKGLYGVDIKQKGHQVYVIEVNDNPNTDHRVEDAYLGDELYMMVMQEFVNRMEKRGLR